jgi:hypothetical protein
MKTFGFGSYAISGGVALALLAGCGGPQSPPLSAASGGASSPQYKASGPLLYVSNDGEAHNVTVYRADAKDPSPIATISDDLEFPAGMCVDGQGTLYVADQTGWIAEYPAGKTTPSKVITKGTDNPGYCVIDWS